MARNNTPKDLALALYLASRHAAPEKIEASIRTFVARMVKDGRADILPSVLAMLPEAEVEVEGGEKVLVESAGPVTEEMVDRALELAGVDRKRAIVVRKIAPELIGGLRVKTGDLVLDLSIKKQIEDLRTGSRRR